MCNVWCFGLVLVVVDERSRSENKFGWRVEASIHQICRQFCDSRYCSYSQTAEQFDSPTFSWLGTYYKVPYWCRYIRCCSCLLWPLMLHSCVWSVESLVVVTVHILMTLCVYLQVHSLSDFIQSSRVQKVILKAVACSLTPTQMSDLADEFFSIDKERLVLGVLCMIHRSCLSCWAVFCMCLFNIPVYWSMCCFLCTYCYYCYYVT